MAFQPSDSEEFSIPAVHILLNTRSHGWFPLGLEETLEFELSVSPLILHLPSLDILDLLAKVLSRTIAYDNYTAIKLSGD
jgi:hypothetical protein